MDLNLECDAGELPADALDAALGGAELAATPPTPGLAVGGVVRRFDLGLKGNG